MKTLKVREVLTKTQTQQMISSICQKWDITDDQELIYEVFKMIFADIRNFKIAFDDPNEFLIDVFNTMSIEIPNILNRLRYLKLNAKFLADYENYKVINKNNSKFSQNYDGFNVDGEFTKNSATNESWADNPLIFMPLIQDFFKEDMERIKKTILNYCLVIY